MNRVLNKVAIVTGGAAGIGRAAAFALAREGAKVVAADINFEGAESVVREIRGAGFPALAVRHDVGDERSWNALIEAVTGEFGRLDVLVNNAGVGTTKLPELVRGSR